jgi:hypothetical protein
MRHEGDSKEFVCAREDDCGCDGWRADGNSSLGAASRWRGYS